MRISDWSSDVCSSDLPKALETADLDLLALEDAGFQFGAVRVVASVGRCRAGSEAIERRLRQIDMPLAHDVGHFLKEEGHQQRCDMCAVDKIGRASSRERECQYV